ncbi:Orf21; putative lipoprotein [hydrothermal vent metagenome]|uniref:Orf21 putative lipoprotein n=1 Tax=hydrothermal vent metagenome TaxID=652676 RepID=A0A3B0RHV8_9ZZZZ
MFKIAGLSLGVTMGVTMLATMALATEEYESIIMQGMADGDTTLTNAGGMTLYTFDKDKPGASNCNGGCAKKWPPVGAETAGLVEDDCTVITRKDGSLQWAYKGAPFCAWIRDAKAGQTSGDGLSGKWHTVKP